MSFSSVAARGDGDNMTIRTLVLQRLQFGLEPLAFRRGATRVLARVAGRPRVEAQVTVEGLQEDFRLDAAGAEALLRALVARRLLERANATSDYRLTERFREFALARVVPPLERARAKRLIERAGMLAAQVNAKWTRNPFAIAMIAVSGSYMSRSRKLPELNLWLIVRPRLPGRARVWELSSSRADGARRIRDAVRSLSSYIVVRLVTDAESLPRPFSVAFRADDLPAPPPIFVALRVWSDSVRRRIGRHRSDARPVELA
jgi:hypothetical protein